MKFFYLACSAGVIRRRSWSTTSRAASKVVVPCAASCFYAVSPDATAADAEQHRERLVLPGQHRRHLGCRSK
jgi:hypothetical protein